MKISVYRIQATDGGAEAEISVEIANGVESQHIKGRISAAMLSALGLPASVKQPIFLEREKCDALFRCMKLYAAIKKGIDLLGYAKNTAKTLQYKLKRKGFSEDIAKEAVEFLSEKGYIREDEDAYYFAQTLAERKRYGKSRIQKEMFAKGFSSETIRETLDILEVDFTEICAARLDAMGGASLFETPEDRKKITASLLRYGFSYAEIREAQTILRAKE